MTTTRIRRRVVAALVAAAALSGTACTQGSAHPATRPAPTTVWALLDADTAGAVVLGTSLSGDTPSQLFGVNRDGKVAWRADTLASRLPTVVCARQCPAAIASSSMRSANELAIADEPPVQLGDQPATGFATGHKMSVLASDPAGLVQEITDATGRTELRIPGADAVRAIAGWGTHWRRSNDHTVAVAMTPVPRQQAVDVRVFLAHQGGWRAVGGVTRSNSMFGCASGTTQHLIVSDPSPTIVSVDNGLRTAIPGLEAGGDCGFVADGAVVAQYAVTGAEYITKIVTVDPAGKPLATATYPFEARISTDLAGRGHVIILQRHAEEKDLHGRVLQKIDDVADARYTVTGEIVSVSATGVVRWSPSRGRD
jgi:hypothetical protein